MTYLATIHPDAATPFFGTEVEDLEALSKALARARHSYFDQHIIRMDDGCCWVADDGDYEGSLGQLGDRIVHTVPAGRTDE